MTTANHPPEEVEIFVCYTNTDLTEGRGQQIPYAWALLRATADRLAVKKGVMGSNADVRPVRAFKVGAAIYGPVKLERPTVDDEKAEAARIAREEVTGRALAAGLTKEDLAVLRSKA